MNTGTDQLLRALVESATDFAIITIDRGGAVSSWNIGAERLLGWTNDEIVGQDSRIFFTPEDRAAGKPEQEMRIALAEGRAEDERWHVRKDESRFWGSGSLMPLQERSLGFVKILRDRTEQRRASEKLEQSIGRLRDSEERFRLLATNIPQLVFQSRDTGARTWGSPQWEVYAGLSDARSRDFQWLDAVHPEDRRATVDAWRQAQETGKYYVEHRIKRAADGEYRWHQTRAVPIAGSPDGEWVGTSADIHDLRTLQHRQEVILAEIHHRTRNLLALVQATARKTLRRSSSLAEFGAEFEGRLRALSRVQSLLSHTTDETLDVRTIVDLELAATRDLHGGKVDVDGASIQIPASAIQVLALALHELATNAVKYGALSQPSGHLSVSWRAEDGDARGPCVVLDWKETGVVIPPRDDPPKRGYGRELIERALPYQLGARTDFHFDADGVRCRIAVPVTLEREGRKSHD